MTALISAIVNAERAAKAALVNAERAAKAARVNAERAAKAALTECKLKRSRVRKSLSSCKKYP